MAEIEFEEVRILRDELEKAQKAKRNLEDRIEKMAKLIGSAKININTAVAIEHLKRYNTRALGTNVAAELYCAMTSAIQDLDKAEEAGDIIPF